jgi:putative transposase
MILSYKYRVYPNQAQTAALSDMLGDFCQLYNAALDERISAYKAVANARHEIIWGTYKDRRGVEREGYIRRHLATVTASTANCIKSHSQIVALPIIRRDLPHIARWSATAEQQIMRRVDKTFQAFFNRVKRGEKAGFPRFKSRDRFHAAEFRVGDGLTLRKSGKIGFVGVPGEIKVQWHREPPSKPASVLIRNYPPLTS